MSEFLKIFTFLCKTDFDERIESAIQSANVDVSKCQNCTLELSLEELALINILKNNPTL